MHRYFAEDGKTPCRAADAFYTVVTREPEWDDDSRGRALRLAEYEAGLCPCGCGLPADVARSKVPMVVDTFTCYASRALDAQKRADQDAHAKDPKRPPRDPHGNPIPRWDDGRNYFVIPQD